jgi:hypothetical protein
MLGINGLDVSGTLYLLAVALNPLESQARFVPAALSTSEAEEPMRKKSSWKHSQT